MAAPFILIEYGAPHVVEQLPAYKPNRLALMAQTGSHCNAFDAQVEYQQKVRNVPSFGLLSKVLAYTIYNPIVKVDAEWTVCGQYDPARIVALVNDGLQYDDDIIQQWFSADDVLKLLRAANSFDTMVLAVKCICGEHEVSDEARSYVNDVL